jgi:hypothetical protein
MEAVRSLGGVTLVVRAARQSIPHAYPLDHEHLFLDDDVAFRVGAQPSVAGVYPARFQRATESSCKSTGGGRDHEVERCCMVRIPTGLCSVVLPDLRMRPEDHRFGLDRHVRLPNRAALPNYPDPRNVLHFIFHVADLLVSSARARYAT